MASIKEQQTDWIRYRQRLERESRVLVVDGESNAREQLDELLFRGRIPSRSVGVPKQALELVAREHYSLVVIADVLPAMRGIELAQRVRETNAEVDVLLSTWQPSVELLGQAFAGGVLDVVVKPFNDPGDVIERMKHAVRRHVDRRMRGYVLNELRHALDDLDEEARLRTVSALERRLAAFKSALGETEKVLVVEADSAVRTLSESLLLSGMSVETSEYLNEAMTRAALGDVLLLAVSTPLDEAQAAALVAELNDVDPHIELALVAAEPSARAAISALRNEVAAYIPWPPSSPMSQVTGWLRDILRRGRQARLVDNLFVELYRETTRARGEPDAAEDQAFQIFRRVIGLEEPLVSPRPIVSEEQQDVPATTLAQLDQALNEILADLDDRAAEPMAPPESAGPPPNDRRVHTRVADSQFVRFRPPTATSAVLAYLGDLSEGGVFIRTANLLRQGEPIEVDINAEYQGNRYLVCCQGEVAWIARDEKASAMAPGFGVRFVDPPEDVVGLLRQMVAARDSDKVQ